MAQAKRVSINQRDIGNDSPPHIRAEISANHNGKLNGTELISQERGRRRRRENPDLPA